MTMTSKVADGAADVGRRRVDPVVIDARRNLSVGGPGDVAAISFFFFADARTVDNHDGAGGTAPDVVVWSAGSLSKERRTLQTVRDSAMVPGPAHILDSQWIGVRPSVISDADVVVWFVSWFVSVPVKIVSHSGHPSLACTGWRSGRWRCLFC